MKRKALYKKILLIILFSNFMTGYSQTVLDSLYLKLAENKIDTCRVELLNDITSEYRINNPKKAFEFNTLAIDLAKELNYVHGLARAYGLLGSIHLYRGDNIPALNNYIKSQGLFEKLHDTTSLANVINYIGQVYYHTKDYEKSLTYFNKASELYRSINDFTGLAIMSNNIGNVFISSDNDSMALINYEYAYEMNKKINRQPGMGFASMNVGNIYLDRKNYEKAIEYYTISLHHMMESDNKMGLSQANYNIGNAYVYLKVIDSASSYLLKSKQIADDYELFGEKALILNSLADLYRLEGNCEAEKNCLAEYIEIKDSLLKIQMDTKILELEQKFELEQVLKEQEFELEQKSRKLKISTLQKYILGLILLSVFIIGGILINRKALKIKYINEKLKSKDNELINLAMYILQKNDLIHEFRQQLLKLYKKLTIEDNKKTVDEIINSLIFKIAISKDIEKFRDKLRIISEDFYSKIDQKFPGLTEKEKQMATLLRLDLTSKQIGVILNNTTESIETSRYRLRKKLGLSADENLSNYFNQI